jgi:glycosyltransferase involved in cell wall biosynthesis
VSGTRVCPESHASHRGDLVRMAIYTCDLTKENQHLMPWRMVLEIGRGANQAAHQATVLSGVPHPAQDGWTSDGCPVEEMAKPYSEEATDDLRRIVHRDRFDILFWPVAWWVDRQQRNLLRNVSLPIVWYVPGACYPLRQAMRAIPKVGVRATAPFLLQSVYPKRQVVRTLRRPAASLMITASEFTRAAACRAGWPAADVFVVPPGRPPDRLPANGDEPRIFHAVQSKLAGRPFYLFLGPPTGIRGIGQLLEAFDSLACRRFDVCLVCLFRSDPGSDVTSIRRKLETSLSAYRIVCVWESVGRTDLDAFLEACYAVVLPFLLVPSEIPLAVIEAAGHGKPVITTGPGGTADFVRDFGLAVPAGRSHALAHAMLRLLDDTPLYAQKCAAAQRVYAAHALWDEVAQSWLSVAEKAIQRTAQVAVKGTS